MGKSSEGTEQRKFLHRHRWVKPCLWVIVLPLACFKVDLFLGGLFNFPQISMLRLIALPGFFVAVIWAIIAILKRRGFLLALAVLLYCQPYLPEPMYPYALGIYCRIRSSNLVSATNDWATNLSPDDFRRLAPDDIRWMPSSSPAEKPDSHASHPVSARASEQSVAAANRPILVVRAMQPEAIREAVFGLMLLDPQTRQVEIRGGGHFIGQWSLVIGQNVGHRAVGFQWAVIIDDNAYLSAYSSP